MNKVFKSRELQGINRCEKRRKRSLHLDTGKMLENRYRRAVVLKQAIKSGLEHGFTDADVEKTIAEEFEKIPWATDETKKLNLQDSVRQVLRYLKSETRTPEPALPKIVCPFGLLDVEVAPDVIFHGRKAYEYSMTVDGKKETITVMEPYIEVVKFCCKKPDVSQTGRTKDRSVRHNLELYSMLMYARELEDQFGTGELIHFEASFYFLRQKTDSKDVFYPNFFETKGTGNVVTLSERKNKALLLDEKHETDRLFKPQFEEYVTGEVLCDPKACDKCEFACSCYYTKPPIRLEEEKKTGKVQDVMLTKEQQNAVMFRKGFARINAGAGAGKTLVSALRVAYMLDEGIPPEKICMLTFTNTGAEEMRQRVKQYCDDLGCDADVSLLTSTTFNSFGESIVRKNYRELGFSKEPRLIDDIERFGIIARLLQHRTIDGLDYKNFAMNSKYAKGALHAAREAFDVIKRERLAEGDGAVLKDKMAVMLSDERGYEELLELYAEYDAILHEKHLMEFADQELCILDLVDRNPFYFEEYGYEHIMVDEFQDTNEIQWKILMALIDTPFIKSFMVVGDDSQSIFSFRGSVPDFIVNFWENLGEEGEDFYLLENHRSTPEIIEFANKINALNEHRVEKDLIATRPSGAPVIVQGFWNKDEEYTRIVEWIKKKHEQGFAYEDMAFIASKRTELLAMGTVCTEAGIPWVMLNPEKFLENSRVSGAVALAMLISDPSATQCAFKYLNVREHNTLLDTKTDAEIQEMVLGITNTAVNLAETKNTGELRGLMEVLNEDDEIYEDFLKKVFIRTDFDEMIQYVLDYNEYGENEAKRRESRYPGVVLTTSHSSKGKEWPIVFNSISKYHTKETKNIEETRRLFFVSATRARDELYVTGQKIAYGKKGERTYNRFLIEGYHIQGQIFDTFEPSSKAAG